MWPTSRELPCATTGLDGAARIRAPHCGRVVEDHRQTILHDVHILQNVQQFGCGVSDHFVKMLLTNAAARSTYGIGVSSASFGLPLVQLSMPERMAVKASAEINTAISLSGRIF